MLGKIIKWFIKSSANPEKISLTLKAGIPFAISAFLYFGVTLEAADLINLINGLVMVLTGVPMIWGTIRKIILTAKKKKNSK